MSTYGPKLTARILRDVTKADEALFRLSLRLTKLASLDLQGADKDDLCALAQRVSATRVQLQRSGIVARVQGMPEPEAVEQDGGETEA